MISNFPSLFIALRYLKPSKKNTMVSIISLFSFLGIVLGVGTLIIVMSVMNGFKIELFNKIIGINGHLNIHFYENSNTDNLNQLLKSDNNIKSFIKIIDGQGLISSKNISTGTIIKGISNNDFEKVCWMVVHEHLHGFMPVEYDIREIEETLYLLLLKEIKLIEY